jgi:hypothetical protein
MGGGKVRSWAVLVVEVKVVKNEREYRMAAMSEKRTGV